MFATCHIVTINKSCDENVTTIGISKNSDEFALTVEQFTGWQTEVNNYTTTLKLDCEAKNSKFNLPSEPGSNLRTGLSLIQLPVIEAINKNSRTEKQYADAQVSYNLVKNEAYLVDSLQDILI